MQKLLYIGTMAPESTSYARFCALKEHYEIETVEFSDINKGDVYVFDATKII